MEANQAMSASLSTPHVQERYSHLAAFLSAESRALRLTKSLCPECLSEGSYSAMLIDAQIYEEGGKVWQVKHCKVHGITKEIYWEDSELYHRASRYLSAGVRIENPNVSLEGACPRSCGLCSEHSSHTALGNIVVTNRCNLACWYCFFYAREDEHIYEPSVEQIRAMLRNMKRLSPVGANVVQFTGGEPTLREDLISLIRVAREEGYQHIMVNTNGVRISQDAELAAKIAEAGRAGGGNIILYMSFDGVTQSTNPKNYWEVPGAIQNCRKAGLGVVLVPTVIKGVNHHQLGDILKFAAANLDVVRGVNFQPVSLVGRMPPAEREKRRITIPGVIKALEEQLPGVVYRDDFFPVPCVSPLTDLLEFASGEHKYRLSIHFACGMATYLFKDGERLRSIAHFIDIEGLLEYLKHATQSTSFLPRALLLSRILLNMRKFIRSAPEGINPGRVLSKAALRGDYTAFLDFHKNSLFIGMMHFQDAYNYDVERVKRCDIHYATPDGRIIPFCAFNVLPAMYRDAVQKEFSIPAREWEARNGKKLRDDRYRRNLSEEEKLKVHSYYAACIKEGSRLLAIDQ